MSQRSRFYFGLAIAAIAVSILFGTLPNFAANPLLVDVQALIEFGPRVAGSANVERASEYLIDRYRKAGYQTEIQTFTYPKFADLGSSLNIDGRSIEVWAMVHSIAGTPTGKLVAVPNFGSETDFAQVSVAGAIAIVKRGGGVLFAQKIEAAAKAGAIGIIIVNNQPENVRGMLPKPLAIPAVAVSEKVGQALFDRAQSGVRATLSVKTQPNAIGRNIIAHSPGVTQPKLIIGAHYDSVAGSPGANDNASGTAVVLGLARNLAPDIARQVWLVSFDGEEDGLKGSAAFVDRATPQFLAALAGMINFDMVGVNEQLLLDGSGTFSTLLKRTPSLLASTKSVAVDSSQFGSSDHASFKSKQVSTLFFLRGKETNYHSPKDTTVNPILLTETQQTALEIIPQLLRRNNYDDREDRLRRHA